MNHLISILNIKFTYNSQERNFFNSKVSLVIDLRWRFTTSFGTHLPCPFNRSIHSNLSNLIFRIINLFFPPFTQAYFWLDSKLKSWKCRKGVRTEYTYIGTTYYEMIMRNLNLTLLKFMSNFFWLPFNIHFVLHWMFFLKWKTSLWSILKACTYDRTFPFIL